jgi:DNA helicase HerA-like ATPase
LPFVVVIEEAHNFVPAHPLTDAERASGQLTRTIASEGRKFGVGLIMISQRPSRLDETALTMCNSFIIMRLVNPADQRFVKAVIETVGEEEAKLLPDLDRGEALISGQCVQFPVMARIKRPHSQGEKQEKDLIRLVMEEE